MSLLASQLFDVPGSLLPWRRRRQSAASRFSGESIALSIGRTDVGRTHSNRIRPRFARTADPVEVVAILPMLEAPSRHLQQTATDLQDFVLAVSSGFGGMETRARETLQIAQRGLNSDEARIVRLNGRLEAARAGVHGAAFNVIVNETKNLGVCASETSYSIRKQVQQLDASLKAASRELQACIMMDAETAHKSHELVTRLLDQFSIMHHGMADSLHRTEHLIESLSRDIGRSVIALQFQERVHQRLDHVVEALAALQENLTPFLQQVSVGRAAARSNDWRE